MAVTFTPQGLTTGDAITESYLTNLETSGVAAVVAQSNTNETNISELQEAVTALTARVDQLESAGS